ncbi:MAG: DUF4834 family protein [Janthinobacterium lividum]
MSFLLALLIFSLLVRYLLPVVLRAVLGSLVRQQVRKAQEGGFYAPTSGQQRAYTPPAAAPGQVRVDFVPPKTAKVEQKPEFRGGEYVDYEEVK